MHEHAAQSANKASLNSRPHPREVDRGDSQRVVKAGDGDLQVLDARGNLVQARRLGLYGENRLDLDLGDAAPGLYLVRLTCEGRTAEVRVVKE